MKREDYEGPPCACGQCVQAGVSHLKQRRDPQSGAWLHGYDLRRWHEAKNAFVKLRETITPKDMP